jgi:hypothetical protein
MNKTIIIFCVTPFLLFSQNFISNETSVQAGSFSITIQKTLLNVFDEAGKNVYREKFFHPSGMISDLDADGIDEYIIIDSIFTKGEPAYKIFLFNTVDSFYLVDSISSGRTFPYFEIGSQTNEVILLTGIPEFDKYNSNPEYFFSPLNCWKYESSRIYLNNEENYELLLNENDDIIEFLENFSWGPDSCVSSKKILGAIVSAYINYINAGETAISSQFLKKYYLCSDIVNLKKEIQELLEAAI